MSSNDHSAVPLPLIGVDWLRGGLSGAAVRRTCKHLGAVRSLFLDGAGSALPDDTILYSVAWFGAGPDSAGGLLFGCTRIEAGKVGNEYFMTHGHFHAQPTRAEFYIPVSGQGLLLLMDRDGKTWAEAMRPGHIHAIDGRYAHRVVNTGSEPLVFWACWPADAGYDYDTIVRTGFGLRILEQDGKPLLVQAAHGENPSVSP